MKVALIPSTISLIYLHDVITILYIIIVNNVHDMQLTDYVCKGVHDFMKTVRLQAYKYTIILQGTPLVGQHSD